MDNILIAIFLCVVVSVGLIAIWMLLGARLADADDGISALIWPITLLKKRRESKEPDMRERWLAHEQEMRNRQLDRALELALAQRDVSSKHRRKKRTTKRKPRKKQDKTVVVETRLEL